MTIQMCPHCEKIYKPALADQPGFPERLARWKKGELIQKVWPEATPEEREQIVSGVCSDQCWKEMLGPEE
jgi:hypothetical protein